MSNRAYLYSSDRQDAGVWNYVQRSKGYCDSGWRIPLAWFFFFRASNIQLVSTSYNGGTPWQEVKLLANKEQAVHLFASRQPLLLSITSSELGKSIIPDFLEDVSHQSGNYLLMDPEEVFGGMPQSDEEHYEAFRHILTLINAGVPNAGEFLQAISTYTGVTSESAGEYMREVIVVGNTYTRPEPKNRT